MRQISQSYRTGELKLVDLPTPGARAGSLVVETRASLVSAGTERAVVELARKGLVGKARERPDLVAKVIDKVRRDGLLVALDLVRAKLDHPVALGYSLAGRVSAVPPGLPGFAVGDRVACGGAGIANHAEINVVPVNLAVPIPDAVEDEEAAFVTVGAIALHGVRLSRPTFGGVACVIGLGLLGQLAVSFLAAQGCDVIGVDIDRAKVERALGRGAVAGGVDGTDDIVEIVRAASRGRGADAIVITASAPTNAPLVLAAQVARDRARVAVVGTIPLEIPRQPYFEKELEVVVSRSYGPGRYDPEYEDRGHDYPIGYVRWTERRNFEAVLDAIARRRIEVRSLITHRFPFEAALDAYALVTGEVKEPHLGVVLTYGGSSSSDGAGVEVKSAPPAAQDEVGVAVVGTGSFASAVLVPALAKTEGARIVASVSGRGLSARQVADQHHAEVEATLDAALQRADVTAVVIATRHDLHAAQAARALEAGRDVFMEKPAAIDEDQLALLERAVSAARGRLMVGFNRRFAPFAEEVRRTFAGRRAGLVMTARVNAGAVPAGSWVRSPEEGGGRLIGEGCHFVDLLSSFAGAPPRRVSAHAIGPGGAFARDDNVVVSLAFEDGSVATIVYTAMGDARVGKERYEIFGEGTVAVIDDWQRLEITRRGKTTVHRALRPDKGHAAEIDAFVRACRRGEPSPTPWASVAATTRATFAIEIARTEGLTVEL